MLPVVRLYLFALQLLAANTKMQPLDASISSSTAFYKQQQHEKGSKQNKNIKRANCAYKFLG